MEPQEILNLLQVEVGTLIAGWLAIILGLVLKDILTSVAFGAMFFIDPQFTEGDTVYIDDDEAIIQKIGFTTTIFKITKTSRWRYVKNGKIRYHKLEKQIEKKEER